MVEAELRRAGFDLVCTRVDTEAGYLAAHESPVDLILADYSLPALRALLPPKLLAERRIDLPVVVVTGLGGPEPAVEGHRDGAIDLLRKDPLAQLPAATADAVRARLMRAERHRIQQRVRFQANVHDAFDRAVVATDIEGAITYWNPAADSLYGWEASNVAGRNVATASPLRAPRRKRSTAMHEWPTARPGRVKSSSGERTASSCPRTSPTLRCVTISVR